MKFTIIPHSNSLNIIVAFIIYLTSESSLHKFPFLLCHFLLCFYLFLNKCIINMRFSHTINLGPLHVLDIVAHWSNLDFGCNGTWGSFTCTSLCNLNQNTILSQYIQFTPVQDPIAMNESFSSV